MTTCPNYNVYCKLDRLLLLAYCIELWCSSCMRPCLLAHDNSQTTYEVWYRGVDSPNDVDGSFFEVVTVAPGMTLSVTISGLMPYSAYNVSVRATNQYGVGNFSEEVTVRTEEGGECVPWTASGAVIESSMLPTSPPQFRLFPSVLHCVAVHPPPCKSLGPRPLSVMGPISHIVWSTQAWLQRMQ